MGQDRLIRLLPRPLRKSAATRRGYVVVEGMTLPIDPTVMSPRMIGALANGRYEQTEARTVKHLLSPDDHVLELGAGLGLISTLAARQATRGSVTTYEANPDLIPLIRKTHAMNAVTVEVRHAVLGTSATPHTMTFYKSRDFWASSLSPQTPQITGTVDVPVEPLDNVIASLRPTALIFDIEGGEYPLLAEASLPGVQKIMGEFHPGSSGLAAMGTVIRNFLSQGFEIDTTLSQPDTLAFRRTSISQH